MQDTEAGEITKAKTGQIIAEDGNKQYVKRKTRCKRTNQPSIYLVMGPKFIPAVIEKEARFTLEITGLGQRLCPH